MPPANSPNVSDSGSMRLASANHNSPQQETRPSTPPTGQGVEVQPSSTLYLRQLAEAISTPVPDLASTLNLQPAAADTDTPSDLRTELPRGADVRSRTVELWDGRSVLHLSREDDTLLVSNSLGIEQEQELDADNLLRRSSRDHASRRPYLTESEFQNWTIEGRRRLLTQSQRYRDDFINRSAETTASGPVRQRLHDWASVRNTERRVNNNENDASDEAAQRRSAPNDAASRRELDRALRSYRIARNALRSGRNSAAELGPVPTASALRAYWNEEAAENHNDDSSTINTASTAALNDFLEQHRTERQRRHIELARLHAERRLTQPQPSSNTISHNGIIYSTASYPTEPSRYSTLPGRYSPLPAYHREARTSDAFPRVRNTIRYLSGLREASVEGGLELARSLNLDPLYESSDATTATDLPMTIDSLPKPQYSSWLQPGMVWHGLQSTDREPTPPPTLASTLRRERQREYLRRSTTRRTVAVDYGDEESVDNLERSRSIIHLPETGNPNLDSERVLSELLRDVSTTELDREDSRYQLLNESTDTDHWPVVVTLHEVDLDSMTVSGTMAASQIPDKVISGQRSRGDDSPPPEAETGKSMESFFKGEIIDFRHHTLETEGKKFNYRVGGVDVDARYWARLQPFKQEIDKASVGKRLPQPVSYNGLGNSSDKAGVSSLDRDDDLPGVAEEKAARDTETDEVMARCLGSRKWIEEKLGNEWVLMRWKEKCFINLIKPPSSSHTRSYSYSATNNHRHQASSTTTFAPTNQSQYYTTENPPNSAQQYTSWGLTISGFYYVALNRLTGQIDGLYYDPGSQPYQALKMVPLGCQMPTTRPASTLPSASQAEITTAQNGSNQRGDGLEITPCTTTASLEVQELVLTDPNSDSPHGHHHNKTSGAKHLVQDSETDELGSSSATYHQSSSPPPLSPSSPSTSSIIDFKEFAGKPPLGKLGGCRKWFPAVEFR